MCCFQEYPTPSTALKNDKVDAMGVNTFSGIAFAKKEPSLETARTFSSIRGRSVCARTIRSGAHFVNVTMQELWQQGTYQTLYEKHFGDKPNFKMWSEFRLQPGIGAKVELTSGRPAA